jgi:hypothetical protein
MNLEILKLPKSRNLENWNFWDHQSTTCPFNSQLLMKRPETKLAECRFPRTEVGPFWQTGQRKCSKRIQKVLSVKDKSPLEPPTLGHSKENLSTPATVPWLVVPCPCSSEPFRLWAPQVAAKLEQPTKTSGRNPSDIHPQDPTLRLVKQRPLALLT